MNDGGRSETRQAFADVSIDSKKGAEVVRAWKGGVKGERGGR